MSEGKKVDLNDKILCAKTGKELGGYHGVVKVDPIFEEECRVYSYFDVDFVHEGFDDPEEAIENFTINNNVEVMEFYPIIKVRIFSPYSEEDPKTLVLREEDPDEFINKGRSKYSDQIDEIEETLEFNEGKIIPCYELYLPKVFGKYRGYMDINLENIETYADLLEEMERKALEEYEYDGDPANCLKANYVCHGVLKRSMMDKDYHEAYYDDLKYLIEKNRASDIKDLFNRYKVNRLGIDDEVFSETSMRSILNDLILNNQLLSENLRGVLKEFD
jgi:hypothetical protein